MRELTGLDRTMGDRYSFLGWRWTRGPDMPTARDALAAAAVGGKLYVVGGDKGHANYASILEVYDPSANRWTRGPDMPTARGYLAAAEAGGKIYVIGGYRAAGPVSTLEVFGP